MTMRKRMAVLASALFLACACGSDSVEGASTPDASAPATGGAASSTGGASAGGAGGHAGPGSGGANAGAAGNTGLGSGGTNASGGAFANGGGPGPAAGGASVDAGDGSPGGGPANLVGELSALTANCKNVVSQHQYALDSGATTDICGLTGAIFFTADMDIDCDGKTTTECNSQTDCCYQPDTAFHNSKNEPLTASVTPYVVIPQDFSYPGLAGGNVTAVIYAGKLEWAVFGDTGPSDIIGEASYACAKDLGVDPDPKTGGTGGPVTYITFVGSGTAPADIENRAETQTLGESLAAALIRNN